MALLHGGAADEYRSADLFLQKSLCFPAKAGMLRIQIVHRIVANHGDGKLIGLHEDGIIHRCNIIEVKCIRHIGMNGFAIEPHEFCYCLLLHAADDLLQCITHLHGHFNTWHPAGFVEILDLP